jgi:type F conjugative transfer system protein TrbI
MKMKIRFFGVALLAMVFAGELMGQTAAEHKQTPTGSAVTIPLSPGTAINASLAGTLDSEKNKPGDPVSAIVSESVVYQRSVLIPKGSRIVGHVVRTRGDGEVNSALFVEFDRVILKNGQEAVLNAGIQALAPVGAAPTIPSREKYEENRMAGLGPTISGTAGPQTQVMPSTYTLPSRVSPDVPAQRIEGGLDRRGLFTPDSKGAFSEPNLKVFTPVSEGSHGTVLVGNRSSVHLDSGSHLLIVIQPPATSPDLR